MQFYLDLLAGMTTLQDLSDAELDSIQGMWIDEHNNSQPPIDMWLAIIKETRRREVTKASKIMKRIDKDFFS